MVDKVKQGKSSQEHKHILLMIITNIKEDVYDDMLRGRE